MSRQRQPQNEEKSRTSLYEEITARIVADLERGNVPWVQPWARAKTEGGAGEIPLSLPRNAATGKTYSGINILILWDRMFKKGFASQNWLTFRQAKALGGAVRKGEQGVSVCYADKFVPKDSKTAERGAAARASGSAPQISNAAPDAIPFLRRYAVFNVDRCDGLPDHCLTQAPARTEREIVPEAEELAAATLADIRHGGDHAFYRLSQDAIHVPPQQAFHDQINYYRTLFHELGHWTGHPNRLARDLSGAFGSKPYAREELVAEITAAFVCASLSIRPTVRHADYIGHWLDVLREDNRAIFRAASKASKASDFILAFLHLPVATAPGDGGEAS